MSKSIKTSPLPPSPLPALIAHADWSVSPKKRWMALARLDLTGHYFLSAPEPVGELPSLAFRLVSQVKKQGWVLLGLDFPIGLPQSYAAKAGIDNFLNLLPVLGSGPWSDFYQVAAKREEISIGRPFYPLRPGGTRQRHLIEALGVASVHELRRICERARPGRRAAAPLFWTMGAQQVGKAAICGWQGLFNPAMEDPGIKVAIWPFSGEMPDLCQPGWLVMAETYPAEFYTQLGIEFHREKSSGKSGKRVQASRVAQARRLITWLESQRVFRTPPLDQQIRDGFGPSPDGEDRFDAVIGLIGMLNLFLGLQPLVEPPPGIIREVEGWILGQGLTST